MNVKINTDVLSNEISNIDGYLAEMSDAINNIKTIVNDFGDTWESSAYTDTFVPKMESFIDELNKTKEQVESYKNFCYGYVSASKALDNSYSSKSINLE